MNPKLRAFLLANGLRAEATEQEAWELFDKLQGEGIDMPGIEPGKRSAQGGTPAEPAAQPQSTPAQVFEGKARELDASIQRQIDQAVASSRAEHIRMVSAIDERLQVAGLADVDGGDFRRSLMNDENMTLERASQAIFERLKAHNPPIGTGAQIGTEAPEKIRAAITDGLLLRSGHRLDKPADGAREFRGRHLKEICRELLSMNGVNCRGLADRDIVGRALASGSTSDFPNIFAALVNKSLLRAYMEWPSTWRPFVAITGATDFKAIHAIKLSGAPDLKGLNENGEYQTAKFSEADESYRVITKGIRVPLTREMIINDDLRAFTRIPQLFGVAAKRMEADAIYSLITANAAMASDNTALFHADHDNLTGTGTAISSDSLGVGRAMMRKQKGLAGESIDVHPAFLLTAVDKETVAEVLLRSAALPTADMSAGVHNPWAGKLTPIADPHLDDDDPDSWYLFAHPNQAPVIEAAFLEGEEQPYVEEMVDFNSDALITKVRHDFGCGVVDYVGAYKNDGA